MSFFELTNGKKFNIEDIKAGIKIDKANEFLKKYDKNQNSIFDFDELETFKEDIKPYTDDGKIDKEEYVDWYAKVMGMTVDAVKQLFKTGDKNEIEELFNSSFNSLEEAEAHRECIDIIKNTALKAGTDMLLDDKGSITKLVDKISNFFKGRLSEKQIYKIIFEELMTAEFLEDAEKGELTKSEYIERKIENTKALCKTKIIKEVIENEKARMKQSVIFSLNKELLANYLDGYLENNFRSLVKQAAENADGKIDVEAAAEALNKWVENVLSMDEKQSMEFFTNICTKACEEYQELHKNDWGTDGKHIQIGGNDSLSFDDTEKLTFNQVFKLERNKDFSVENFNAYKKAESNMQFVSSAYNKLSLTLSDIDGIMQEYKDARINHEELGNDFEYTSLTPNAQKRIPNIIQLFANYYMGDAELASQDLNKMIKDKDIVAGLKIISNDDGSLSIEFDKSLDNDTKRNDALNNLLEIFKSRISKRFENILGGKKLEDYAQEYTKARDKAVGGTDLDSIIQAYQGKNANIIDQVAGAAQTGGMVLIVVGGILCMTPLALTGIPEAMTALGGNIVVGTMALEYGAKYLEMFTKEEVDDKELEDLNKHFIMDAGGMIIGIKAGKMGNKVFGKMLDKNLAKVLKKPLSEVNRIKDFKAIAKSPEQLKNLMQAFGGKVSTDFLISYAGDLAMMGALGGVEGEDWTTLLRANLMGLAIGTTSDISDLGNVGMRRERLKELRDKQAQGIQLDPKDMKELAALEKEFAEIDKPEMGLTEKPAETESNRIENRLDLNKTSYETYTDKDGNKIYKVVASATPNEKHGGYDFTFDVYKVDNDGNVIEELKGLTDKEIRKKYGKLKNRQIHDNSSSDNSGYAYSGVPFFKKIWNTVVGKADPVEESYVRRENNLESNEPIIYTGNSRSVEECRQLLEEACNELINSKNYNFFNDIQTITNRFLAGIYTDSIIFKDKNSLKEYLTHCYNMTGLTNPDGNNLFTKRKYDSNSGEVRFEYDDVLIRDVATLMVTDPKMHESLGNLVGMFMDGEIDEFSFRAMIHYVKQGYISPSTIDISLESLITTDGQKNVGMYYIESLYMPYRNDFVNRDTKINYLANSDSEIRNAIENLKAEIGDEIYNFRWECVPEDDKNAVLNFIKDAKNIRYINKTMLGSQNFQIRIPGYDSKDVWLHDIPEIANAAAAMLDEGSSFDEVASFIAMSYRDLDLKTVKPGQDKGKYTNSGVLRCEREGHYHENSGFDGDGVHTSFGYTDRYGICYVDKFKKVAYPNQLMIPNGYNIGLTRIVYIEREIDLGEYSQNIQPVEISYKEYKHRLQNNEKVSVGIDKTNGKKHYYRENDEKNYVTTRKDIYGNMHYYKIEGNMMHPNGKYVNNALNIVHSIQDMLMDKYHGKDLTEADMDDINESIGEIHWILSHSMPWGRGSAGISDAYVKALYKSLGIQLSQPKEGISFDLEAFCTELEDYKKNYKNLYEREPKYVE